MEAEDAQTSQDWAFHTLFVWHSVSALVYIPNPEDREIQQGTLLSKNLETDFQSCRACVCAAVRIDYTIKSIVSYEENITYSFGPSYLLCLAEALCAILILTIPSFPKAFGDSSISQAFKRHLLSWINTLTRSSKDGSATSTRPRGSSFNPKASIQVLGTYQRMSDTELSIPLHTVPPRSPSGYSPQGQKGHRLPEILCTTEIRTDISTEAPNESANWIPSPYSWSVQPGRQ